MRETILIKAIFAVVVTMGVTIIGSIMTSISDFPFPQNIFAYFVIFLISLAMVIGYSIVELMNREDRKDLIKEAIEELEKSKNDRLTDREYDYYHDEDDDNQIEEQDSK